MAEKETGNSNSGNAVLINTKTNTVTKNAFAGDIQDGKRLNRQIEKQQ